MLRMLWNFQLTVRKYFILPARRRKLWTIHCFIALSCNKSPNALIHAGVYFSQMFWNIFLDEKLSSADEWKRLARRLPNIIL